VAELAIRTIDCGIVDMAAIGYGGRWLWRAVTDPIRFNFRHKQRHAHLPKILSLYTFGTGNKKAQRIGATDPSASAPSDRKSVSVRLFGVLPM